MNIENVLKYYNELSTSREKETINKALLKRDKRILERYDKKYKRELERLKSITDYRLSRLSIKGNTSQKMYTT